MRSRWVSAPYSSRRSHSRSCPSRTHPLRTKPNSSQRHCKPSSLSWCSDPSSSVRTQPSPEPGYVLNLNGFFAAMACNRRALRSVLLCRAERRRTHSLTDKVVDLAQHEQRRNPRLGPLGPSPLDGVPFRHTECTGRRTGRLDERVGKDDACC